MRAQALQIKGLKSVEADLILMLTAPLRCIFKRMEASMLYRSAFPGDLLSQLERLQRGMRSASELSPSIRGLARGGYPAINVTGTRQSTEIHVFAPGMDPAAIEVHLEKGVLTISGERKAEAPAGDEKVAVHIDERFAGRFRRVVTLPEDADPDGVVARYRDGVLQISVTRKQASQPRRINIQ